VAVRNILRCILHKFPLPETFLFISKVFWILVTPTWQPKSTRGYIQMYLYLEFITWAKGSILWVQPFDATCDLWQLFLCIWSSRFGVPLLACIGVTCYNLFWSWRHCSFYAPVVTVYLRCAIFHAIHEQLYHLPSCTTVIPRHNSNLVPTCVSFHHSLPLVSVSYFNYYKYIQM
jgi:hypothetical protein